VRVERAQISLEDELRVVGEQVATIDLGYGVTVKFKITIADDKSAEEA
jgi:ribosomal protein L9